MTLDLFPAFREERRFFPAVRTPMPEAAGGSDPDGYGTEQARFWKLETHVFLRTGRCRGGAIRSSRSMGFDEEVGGANGSGRVELGVGRECVRGVAELLKRKARSVAFRRGEGSQSTAGSLPDCAPDDASRTSVRYRRMRVRRWKRAGRRARHHSGRAASRGLLGRLSMTSNALCPRVLRKN